MTTGRPERLLTPEEVAERLCISPITARVWMRERKLPTVKIGKRGLLRLREADLDAYIQELSEERGEEK